MKKLTIMVLFCIMTAILLALILSYTKKKSSSYSDINQYGQLKSGDLATDYTIAQVLDDIKTMNLNTINIPIVVNIDNLNSNNMKIEKWSMNRAIELIKKLKGSNIKIILEAYPWIKNGSEYETKFNPTNKPLFFKNWKDNVISPILDKVAIPYNVFAMNIASNFIHLYSYSDYWDEIIKDIRKEYKGFITYKVSWWFTANWDKNSYKNFEEILNNKTLSKIDFISVAAYFELSNNEYNTVNQLKNDLYCTTRYNRGQDIVKQLYELHEKWDKPIFFGELGFPRKAGAAIEPWNENISNITSDSEQANGFKAYDDVFSNKSWILGFSVFAIGNNSPNHWFYPCDESKEIIKNWYNNL